MPGGGAVGALNVVCVDFKARFGVYFGTVRKNQVKVLLKRLCFLGVLLNKDSSAEHCS